MINRRTTMSGCQPESSPSLWPEQAMVVDKAELLSLVVRMLPAYTRAISQARIPDDMRAQLEQIYLPLAAWVANKHTGRPLVLGINGAQGSGKSTLATILKTLLTEGFGLSVLTLSIDDLYLSKQHRQQLAKDVHPLFKVRGVPGTHDVKLGKQLFSDLLAGDVKLPVSVPVFDKASDDLLPTKDWRRVENPADIILFEGWCVGARPQQEDVLGNPVNELERLEDDDGTWRRYVNEQLSGEYQQLFSYIDYLLMLEVPSMKSVLAWRTLQETKLAQARAEQGLPASNVMSASEVKYFIMHYERITCSILEEMPGRADILLRLNAQHQVDKVRVRK